MDDEEYDLRPRWPQGRALQKLCLQWSIQKTRMGEKEREGKKKMGRAGMWLYTAGAAGRCQGLREMSVAGGYVTVVACWLVAGLR